MSFEDGLKVCIGNYGYYNEGQLRDKWITLPMGNAELDAFLRENGLWDPMHEEIYISDYDGFPFGLKSLFGECTPLSELNVLAAQLRDLDMDDYERLDCFLDAVDVPESMLELMNIVEDAKNLPVHKYDFECAWVKDRWGEYLVDRQTPSANLGEQFLKLNSALAKALELDSDAMFAFDVEKYGSCIENNGIIRAFQHHYVDTDENQPETDRYSLEELAELHGVDLGTEEEVDG